ncbi:hypothetical protein [Ligilactobacillus salivarius]
MQKNFTLSVLNIIQPRKALGLSKAKTGNTLSSDNDVNISSEGEDTNYSNDDNTYYGGY